MIYGGPGISHIIIGKPTWNITHYIRWACPVILCIVCSGPTCSQCILYMGSPSLNITYYIWQAHPLISHIIYGEPTLQYRILYMVGPSPNIAYYIWWAHPAISYIAYGGQWAGSLICILYMLGPCQYYRIFNIASAEALISYILAEISRPSNIDIIYNYFPPVIS
jgi:hypothetical protein